MSKYNTFSYIYPTRPKNVISPTDINRWDNNTMIGQPKMNGSNCLIFTNGTIFKSMGRHNQILSNFQLNKSELLELHKPVEKNSWLVINGEYLNKSKLDENKKVFNHKLIIFDLLVLNSEYLLGSTFEKRIEYIDSLYGKNECEKDYLYQYTDNIFRVKSFYKNLKEEYDRLTVIDVIEGLVLKRKNARLELGIREDNNSRSMLKARKPTKNYRY